MDRPYKSQSDLSLSRSVTVFAGVLGAIESLIWIGLTITSIVSYNCLIPVPNIDNNESQSGALFPSIVLKLYFKGNCVPDGYIDTGAPKYETVLEPKNVFIIMCVYLGFSVCWLLISSLLLSQLKQIEVNSLVIQLWIWICVAIAIILMDLALGIIFGIDYNKFHSKTMDTENGDFIWFFMSSVAAISMMIISFKGFVLFIINIVLVSYLLFFVLIVQHNYGKRQNVSDDIMATRPPIQAFDKEPNKYFSNEAFMDDEQPPLRTIELNNNMIARAARMSTDSSLQDRRFRNFATFSQYPSQTTTNKHNLNEKLRPESAAVLFPAPDYSPPATRNTKSQRL